MCSHTATLAVPEALVAGWPPVNVSPTLPRKFSSLSRLSSLYFLPSVSSVLSWLEWTGVGTIPWLILLSNAELKACSLPPVMPDICFDGLLMSEIKRVPLLPYVTEPKQCSPQSRLANHIIIHYGYYGGRETTVTGGTPVTRTHIFETDCRK